MQHAPTALFYMKIKVAFCSVGKVDPPWPRRWGCPKAKHCSANWEESSERSPIANEFGALTLPWFLNYTHVRRNAKSQISTHCAVQNEWVSLGLRITTVCVLCKCSNTFSTVPGRWRSVFSSLKCPLILSARCETPGPHVSLDSVVCKMLCMFECFFSFSYCCAYSAFLPIRIYGVSSQPPRKGGTRITTSAAFVRNEAGTPQVATFSC